MRQLSTFDIASDTRYMMQIKQEICLEADL